MMLALSQFFFFFPRRRGSFFSQPRPPPLSLFSSPEKTLPGEVVSPLARLNQPDPTKKGGRWAPEFVWNTDWAGALDAAEASKKARKEQLAAEEAENERRRLAGISPSASSSGSAGLSLTRTMDLDRMDIDLTEYLVPKDKSRRPTTEELLAPSTDRASARFDSRPPSSSSRSPSSSSSSAADFTAAQKSFQADARRWTRGGKFSRKAASLQQQPAAEAEALAKQAEDEAANYEILKKELVVWAAAAGVGGALAAGVFYGPETSASYAVGAVFGTIYLRLLGRSVDSFAGSGIGGAIGATVGQQRLLLPLILALGFNRYEFLFAEKLGHHAQLLPMLVGFFTYKAAVVGKQAATLLGELGDSIRDGGGGNTRFGGDEE
jgi:ATP synthase protein I